MGWWHTAVMKMMQWFMARIPAGKHVWHHHFTAPKLVEKLHKLISLHGGEILGHKAILIPQFLLQLTATKSWFSILPPFLISNFLILLQTKQPLVMKFCSFTSFLSCRIIIPHSLFQTSLAGPFILLCVKKKNTLFFFWRLNKILPSVLKV